MFENPEDGLEDLVLEDDASASDGSARAAGSPAPALYLTTNHLYFEAYTNEIACMQARLTNDGDTCVHFEWVREGKANSMRVSSR